MELCSINKILRLNIDVGDGRTIIITPQSGIIQLMEPNGTQFLTTNEIKGINLKDKIRILFECEEADVPSPEVK